MKRFVTISMFVAMLTALFLPMRLVNAGTEQEIPNGCEDAFYSGDYEVIWVAAPGEVTYGGSGSQLIIGTDEEDYIDAGSGNDVVCGGGGYDEIHGGSGNDVLNGNGFYDNLYGESGNDELFGNASNTDPFDVGDIVVGGSGGDYLDGGAGTGDECYGDSGVDGFNVNHCEYIEQ